MPGCGFPPYPSPLPPTLYPMLLPHARAGCPAIDAIRECGEAWGRTDSAGSRAMRTSMIRALEAAPAPPSARVWPVRVCHRQHHRCVCVLSAGPSPSPVQPPAASRPCQPSGFWLLAAARRACTYLRPSVCLAVYPSVRPSVRLARWLLRRMRAARSNSDSDSA